MRRQKLVQEILKHSKKIGTNLGTLLLLLSTLTDKGLTKFHKEFTEIPLKK
jgi:hypothetical protein